MIQRFCILKTAQIIKTAHRGWGSFSSGAGEAVKERRNRI